MSSSVKTKKSPTMKTKQPLTSYSVGSKGLNSPGKLSRSAQVVDLKPKPKAKLAQAQDPYAKVNPILVGKGTYGCVYSPAIPCQDPREEYCPACASKLMQEEDAAEQLAEYSALQGIDDEQSYLIKNPKMCKPDPRVLSKVKPCRAWAKPTLLNYKNGGPDMSKILQTKPSTEILRNFANIIKGVAELNRAGVYHLDIKSQNIVSGLNGNGPYRLIDFGLATKPSADKTTYQEFYQSIYYLWPLDMILISEKPGVKEMPRAKLMNHIRAFQNVDNYIARFYDYMYNHRNMYDVLRMAEANEMKLRERGIHNNTISKVDVYSIGCLLLEMSLMFPEFQEPLKELLIDTGILAPIAMERVSSTELYEQYMAKFSHLF